MENAEFYKVRNKYDWAFVTINEATGTFMTEGSFGTYAYTWTAIGDQTLKQFLAGLDFDYFMSKTKGLAYRVFDHDGTIAELRRIIKEARREGNRDKEQTREAWDATEALEDEYYDDQGLFLNAMQGHSEIMDVIGWDDWWHVTRTRDDAQCRGFWEMMWPEIVKAITPAKAVA